MAKNRKVVNKALKKQVFTNEKARLVKNKYKLIAFILAETHYKLKDIGVPILSEYVAEALHLDREWRKLTTEYDRENKDKLEESWIDKNYRT